MFIVAQDYDTPPFALPNLDEVENSETFEDFVDEQEEEILRGLLGDVLYEAFIVGIDNDEELIDQRWKDLRDGVSYDDEDGKSRRWKGVYKLLKPAIFARWLSVYPSTITGNGVVVVEGENSTAINPSIVIAEGQNEFFRIAGESQYQPSTLYQYLYLSGEKYLADVATESDDIQDYVEENFVSPGLDNEFDF